MKYLTITEPRGNIPPPMAEQIFEMGRAWIREALKDGTIDVIYSFPGGGAVTIGSADSHDDLMAKMRDFPMFPFVSWDVRPLVDIEASFDSAIEMFKRIAQGPGPGGRLDHPTPAAASISRPG